jgi:hypothetical protein
MNALSVEKDRIPDIDAYRQPGMEPGRDAWDLLRQVWMRHGPGHILLPVDPFELAVGVAGVLRKAPGFRDPEILLNQSDARDRSRFTCARAIGHYSRNVEMRREGAWEVVDERDFLAVDQGPDDAYATEFAYELLMPRAVLDETDEETGVASLAARFGVTGDVMVARLDRIGWRR